MAIEMACLSAALSYAVEAGFVTRNDIVRYDERRTLRSRRG